MVWNCNAEFLSFFTMHEFLLSQFTHDLYSTSSNKILEGIKLSTQEKGKWNFKISLRLQIKELSRPRKTKYQY